MIYIVYMLLFDTAKFYSFYMTLYIYSVVMELYLFTDKLMY